jgi:hypothetical protein
MPFHKQMSLPPMRFDSCKADIVFFSDDIVSVKRQAIYNLTAIDSPASLGNYKIYTLELQEQIVADPCDSINIGSCEI